MFRFYYSVLFPRIRDDIREYKRLNFHLMLVSALCPLLFLLSPHCHKLLPEQTVLESSVKALTNSRWPDLQSSLDSSSDDLTNALHKAFRKNGKITPLGFHYTWMLSILASWKFAGITAVLNFSDFIWLLRIVVDLELSHSIGVLWILAVCCGSWMIVNVGITITIGSICQADGEDLCISFSGVEEGIVQAQCIFQGHSPSFVWG